MTEEEKNGILEIIDAVDKLTMDCHKLLWERLQKYPPGSRWYAYARVINMLVGSLYAPLIKPPEAFHADEKK